MRYVTMLFLLVIGCVPVRVVEVGKLSPTATGRTYKTYNFGQLNMKDKPFGNFEQNLKFLTAAIDREMETKGFTRGVANPDLIIDLGLAIKEEVQTRETTIRDAPYSWKYTAAGDYGRSYSWQSQEVEVARYKEGHLSFNLVDREKNELIWQADVAGTLDKSEKKMKDRIDTVIKDLFRKFPIKTN